MLTRRLLTMLGTVGLVVVLTATSAGAHSGHTFTSTQGAGTEWWISFGATEPNVVTIDLPAGWRFAHDDQYGNELSSNPNDEESIGDGFMTAAWTVLFCMTATESLDLTWEEDMTGAPAGAAAHYVMTYALGFSTDVWVIEQNDANDDYKFTMDLDQGQTCATQPSSAGLNIYLPHQTSGGRLVHQTPIVAGCYTTTSTYVDATGTSHSGSASEPFGGGTCP